MLKQHLVANLFERALSSAFAVEREVDFIIENDGSGAVNPLLRNENKEHIMKAQCHYGKYIAYLDILKLLAPNDAKQAETTANIKISKLSAACDKINTY